MNKEITKTDNSKIFNQYLFNNFLAGANNSIVWVSLSFWVYLQTNYIMATSVLAGAFAFASMGTGVFWGALVDKYNKKINMLGSSVVSLLAFSLALLVFLMFINGSPVNLNSVWSWILAIFVLIGSVVGNIRNIVMPTLVSLLFEEKNRDKANGLVGMATGLNFAISSIISGFIVKFFGFGTVLIVAILVTILVVLQLLKIHFVEPKTNLYHCDDIIRSGLGDTIDMIRKTPGLLALIFFTTLNNFIGGVFMSLMDPYGLGLVSVDIWGILWGCLGIVFVAGGIAVSKVGLGKNPVRTFFLFNLFSWFGAFIVALQSNIWLFIIGSICYMFSAPVIEASEQTILQKSVPVSQQGRVFGLASSVESFATPMTAVLIGPFTEIVVIPFMTNGYGAMTIGSWFGTGKIRAIALVFTVAGLIGLVFTLLAKYSKSGRLLSNMYTDKQTKV